MRQSKGSFTPDPARRGAARHGTSRDSRHATASPSLLSHWNFSHALHCTAATLGAARPTAPSGAPCRTADPVCKNLKTTILRNSSTN